MAILYKSTNERGFMRQSGAIVANILQTLREAVKPGITTGDLDRIAAEEVKAHGVIPAFKGYHGFPAYICSSVNDEIVHGIPGKRVLNEGDIISIDFGAFYHGWCGDSAITVPVGKVSDEVQKLLRVTESSLMNGIKMAVAGNHLQDISKAVQDYVEAEGFSVVRHYVGHGIGRNMHEDPQVPNYVDPHQPNPVLRNGMVLAIEPMVNIGGYETRQLNDKWTVVTADGSFSAHFEHTIAIVDDHPEILTLSE